MDQERNPSSDPTSVEVNDRKIEQLVERFRKFLASSRTAMGPEQDVELGKFVVEVAFHRGDWTPGWARDETPVFDAENPKEFELCFRVVETLPSEVL